MFSHESANGERVMIGTWSPSQRGESTIITGVFHTTDNAEEAERWHAELSAGRLPADAEEAS